MFTNLHNGFAFQLPCPAVSDTRPLSHVGLLIFWFSVSSARCTFRWCTVVQRRMWTALATVLPTVMNNFLMSTILMDQCSFRYLSRKRPLKLSVNPFCAGFAGLIKPGLTSCLNAHSLSALQVNSGPLSATIAACMIVLRQPGQSGMRVTWTPAITGCSGELH